MYKTRIWEALKAGLALSGVLDYCLLPKTVELSLTNIFKYNCRQRFYSFSGTLQKGEFIV